MVTRNIPAALAATLSKALAAGQAAAELAGRTATGQELARPAATAPAAVVVTAAALTEPTPVVVTAALGETITAEQAAARRRLAGHVGMELGEQGGAGGLGHRQAVERGASGGLGRLAGKQARGRGHEPGLPARAKPTGLPFRAALCASCYGTGYLIAYVTDTCTVTVSDPAETGTGAPPPP